MPFTTNPAPCKKCGEANKNTRLKWHKPNQKYYLQSTCKDCEAKDTKAHQQLYPEKWREYNKKSYQNWSPEFKTKRLLESNKRHKRLREIPWSIDFTEFVTEEAHNLRVLRKCTTGVEWHVDHIIPLNGKDVCGLHVWNNLAVIPKVENLRKGNKNSLYEKW